MGSSARKPSRALLIRAALFGLSIRSMARPISPAGSRISASRSPASPAARSKSASSTIRCATNCSPRAAAAGRGSTARRSARRARNRLANASVEVGWNMRTGADQYVDLLRRVALSGASPFRTGSGALGIAYVAAGRLDGFVEHHINAWDCLAGVLLVSEAGGYVSDFLSGDGLARGNPLIASAPGVRDALISVAAMEGIAL